MAAESSLPFVHRSMHEARAGGFSSQKAFPSLHFPLPVLHESSKQGDCDFQPFVAGKRGAGASWDAGCLTPAGCRPLCTSWLVLHMFKTLTGNILFCWITYQTTQQ